MSTKSKIENRSATAPTHLYAQKKPFPLIDSAAFVRDDIVNNRDSSWRATATIYWRRRNLQRSMQSGRNPSRRNRNIGTAKSGHGQNNKLKIPNGHCWSRFWERVPGGKVIRREVCGRAIAFLIQPTTQGFTHVCTTDDICTLLALIPLRDWEDLDLVCFRQPTRKQADISSVWGRLAYHADFVDEHGQPLCAGAAIVLEAKELRKQVRFGRHPDPQAQAERDRLIEDGHIFNAKGDYRSSYEASRNTVLYRTFLHELGHWVDHLNKVDRPARSSEDIDAYRRLSDLYFQRPDCEREAYAHRFAGEIRAYLLGAGAIPFARRLNSEELCAAGIPETCFDDTVRAP